MVEAMPTMAPARIIVAPNGARKTRADHPALPLTIGQLAACAQRCRAAGADGLHGHVRGADGNHLLDAGLYRELIAEMARQVPGMPVQITTEAVGRYRPEEQRAVVRAVAPEAFSAALKELFADGDDAATTALYGWAAEAGIEVQHILYAAEEVARFAALLDAGSIPPPAGSQSGARHQLLFVLGRYAADLQSDPAALLPFLRQLDASGLSQRVEWMVCAFGRAESAALGSALARGGHARVGFENAFDNADGSRARDNAERVAEVVALARSLGRRR